MADIRIDFPGELTDGQAVTFKAPCNCSAIDGLKVYYKNGEEKAYKKFAMRDTHGNMLSGIGNLFVKDTYVKAILDTTNNYAYLQNADTNGYLEERMSKLDCSAAYGDRKIRTVNLGEHKSLGINCNAGFGGACYLVIASGHRTSGTASFSEVGMIWCGYSGNNFKYHVISCNREGTSQNTSCLTFEVVDGVIGVTSDSYVISVRVLGNKTHTDVIDLSE